MNVTLDNLLGVHLGFVEVYYYILPCNDYLCVRSHVLNYMQFLPANHFLIVHLGWSLEMQSPYLSNSKVFCQKKTKFKHSIYF